MFFFMDISDVLKGNEICTYKNSEIYFTNFILFEMYENLNTKEYFVTILKNL